MIFSIGKPELENYTIRDSDKHRSSQEKRLSLCFEVGDIVYSFQLKGPFTTYLS
jgi:hypothetical protein